MLAKKPVHEPEDLAGLKIRTLPNPVITECLRLMGAAATPLAFGEIYTALAGRRAGRAGARSADHPRQQVLRDREILLADRAQSSRRSPIYMSDATFNRMDPKLREGFLAAAQKAAVDTRAHGLAVEKEALAMLEEKGVTIIDCDKEPFRKRVLPQTENFIKAHPEAKPIVEMIRATQA